MRQVKLRFLSHYILKQNWLLRRFLKKNALFIHFFGKGGDAECFPAMRPNSKLPHFQRTEMQLLLTQSLGLTALMFDFQHFPISTGQLLAGQSLDPPAQMSKANMAGHQPVSCSGKGVERKISLVQSLLRVYCAGVPGWLSC